MMAGFIESIKKLFIEDEPLGTGVEKTDLKNDPGWERFTYPRCRHCGESCKIMIVDDSEFSGKNSYRIKLECPCGAKEIIG